MSHNSMMAPNECNEGNQPLLAPDEQEQDSMVAEDEDFVEPSKMQLLYSTCCLNLILYASIFPIASYFPQDCVRRGISQSSIGVIFAMFPLGATIAGPWFLPVARKTGIRRGLILGMMMLSVSQMLFGFAPALLGEALGGEPVKSETNSGALLGIYIVLRLLGGMFSGLVDSGTMFCVVANFKEGGSGMAVSSAEASSFLGMSIGPVLGGLLYSTGENFLGKDSAAAVAFPTLTLGIILAVSSLILFLSGNTSAINSVDNGMNESSPPLAKVFKGKWADLLLAALSTTVCVLVASVIDPTLALHLNDVFGYSDAQVSAVFLFICGVFFVTSLPFGALVDHIIEVWTSEEHDKGYIIDVETSEEHDNDDIMEVETSEEHDKDDNRDSADATAASHEVIADTPREQGMDAAKSRDGSAVVQKLRLLIAAGFAFLALGYALLGPLVIPGVLGPASAEDLRGPLRWTFWLGLFFYCVGNMLCIAPMLPALQQGITMDAHLDADAALSSIYVNSLNRGSMIGATLGGIFAHAFGFAGMCSIITLVAVAFAMLNGVPVASAHFRSKKTVMPAGAEDEAGSPEGLPPVL